MARTCEFEYSISDADFGFWHPSFGEPDVHTFHCDEPAVVVVGIVCPDGVALCQHGTYEVALCQHHLDGGE